MLGVRAIGRRSWLIGLRQWTLGIRDRQAIPYRVLSITALRPSLAREIHMDSAPFTVSSPTRLSCVADSASAALKMSCGSASSATEQERKDGASSNALNLQHLEEQIFLLVPSRFTTISQIARAIPGELMESLSEQEQGGLSQFLQRRPKLFEVTSVAGMLRARTRFSARMGGNSSVSCHDHKSSGSAGRFGGTGGHSNGVNGALVSNMEEGSEQPTTSTTARRGVGKALMRAPPRIFSTYPTFCIPFMALVQYSVAQSSHLNESDTAMGLWDQLERDSEFLSVVRLYEPSDDLALKWNRTFLSIDPSYQCCSSSGASGKIEVAQETNERYNSFCVQPYEWFRIARIVPYTKTFMIVTPSLLQEAEMLLPPERDPIHVWASAPNLFDVYIGDGDNGELGMLCVRFILHPTYLASSENRTEEELVRQLEELSGPTQRTKKKRRRLRRALQCIKEPLSFLDERVWAHFIFDSLPETTSATAEMVVSMLPEAYKNCTPVQWRTTLQKFPTLFKVYDGPVDLLIQRADLPMVQMRPLQEITPEEVLQEIYKCYPLRFHPEIGVTVSQMLTKLPKAIAQRLYTIENVEKDMLLKHQDKVEILRKHTFFLEYQGGPPVFSANGKLRVPFKSRPEMLQQVRGRNDFLIGFRFIGEWQERLLEKFEKRCQKYDCDFETTGFLPIPV